MGIFDIILNLLDNLYLLVGHITNGTRFPDPLSPEDEKNLFIKYEQGDMNARDEIISRNLRLVAYVVKKYNSHDWNKDDLLSVGTVGLIKAVETFKQDKGNKFAGYAVRCIDNEILMYLRSLKKSKSEISLEEPIGIDLEGNELSLLDVLETPGEQVHVLVENKLLMGKIYLLMDTVLEEKEKMIIKLRYGLGCEPMTQIEIAKILGISRSYVSRIETRVLKLLKKELEKGKA